MDKHVPTSRHLHPTVIAAIVGLALWYLLSAWIGFAGSGYTDYLLVVASLFVFGTLALPLIARHVWRQNHGPDREDRETFRDWTAFRKWTQGDFEIANGRLSSAEAAVEILLPIAAVAFGMTAFAIVALIAG